jgi:carbohydrate-binding DOMON domain-containing protein
MYDTLTVTLTVTLTLTLTLTLTHLTFHRSDVRHSLQSILIAAGFSAGQRKARTDIVLEALRQSSGGYHTVRVEVG